MVDKMKTCMAHRGFSGKAPENTMAAFKMAMEMDCVDSMELDVQLSKDGVPVIIHDFTLKRTTNGTGYVKDKTLEELKKLDAGSWHSDEFTGEKIPTLEEVLLLCKGKCKLNIELKTARGMYKGYEKTVIELIQRYDMEEEVCLTSFDQQVIKDIRKIHTKCKTGLIISGSPLFLLKTLKKAGASILSINHQYLTEKMIKKMSKVGIEIVVWTVNDKERMKEIEKMSSDIQICTNFPNRYEKLK